MPSTCSATWKGGRCTRDAVARALCPGHLQQKRRGKTWSALKAAHGAHDAPHTEVWLSVPDDVAAAVEGIAAAAAVSVPDAYRKALGAGVKALQRKKP